MSDGREPSVTRWGKVPAWWQLLPEMGLDHWGVLTSLTLYADADGVCYPSQATLARRLKRSRPWVNRVIGELAEAGLIKKTARTRSSNNGTTSCEYRIVVDQSEFQRATAVGPATPAGHDDDTACHRGDTTQLEPEQNKTARPDARGPLHPSGGVRLGDACRETVHAGWAPSEAAVERARALRPHEDLEAHAAMFASRSRAKGYRYAKGQIDEAWLGWLAEDRVTDQRKRTAAERGVSRFAIGVRHDPGDRRFAAWATAAAAPKEGATAPSPTRAEADNPWR